MKNLVVSLFALTLLLFSQANQAASPLPLAMQEILPAGWKVEYAPSINKNAHVIWQKRSQLKETLETLRGPQNYHYIILHHQNTLWMMSGNLPEQARPKNYRSGSVADAFRDILPSGWTVEYAPSVNTRAPVSWSRQPEIKDSLETVQSSNSYDFIILYHQNTVLMTSGARPEPVEDIAPASRSVSLEEPGFLLDKLY